MKEKHQHVAIHDTACLM